MIVISAARNHDKQQVIVINNHGGGNSGGGGVGTCGGPSGSGQEATTIVKMDPKKGNTIIVKGGSNNNKQSHTPEVNHSEQLHMPLHFPVPFAFHFPHFHHHLAHHQHPVHHSESHQQPIYNPHPHADASHRMFSYTLGPRFIHSPPITQQLYSSSKIPKPINVQPVNTESASKSSSLLDTSSDNSSKITSGTTNENENVRRVSIDYPVYVRESTKVSHGTTSSPSSSITSVPLYVRQALNEPAIESRSSNAFNTSTSSEIQVNLPVFTRD